MAITTSSFRNIKINTVYLYHEDNRHPQEVRELVQKELPNLRRALALLLEMDKLDAAFDMADSIARFLTIFGLLRERDEMRRRVDEAVKQSRPEGGEFTRAEWLRESGLGEDELEKGHLRAASTRFTALLARMEALPAGTPLGPGSYEHCLTLVRLARCLQFGGRAAAAEQQQREALTLIEALISQQPEDQTYLRNRGVVLGDLADVLRDQGKYAQARGAYEEALKIATQLGDLRQQAVVLTQLGTLALIQRDYSGERKG